MQIHEVFVTPDYAATLLVKNGSNRPLRRNYVTMLIGELRAGRWQTTHQGIAIDGAGMLIDGQHRLAAIVESGIPARMMVATNVPTTTMVGVDGGATRSFMDRAHFAGDGYSKTDAAMARIIAFGPADIKIRSYGEISGVIEQHRDAINFARPTRCATGQPAAVFAVIARAWYTADRERLAEFKNVFQSGTIVDVGDIAAMRLRDFCLTRKIGGTLGRQETYGRAESAVYHFLQWARIVKLRGTKEELFPIPSPIRG